MGFRFDRVAEIRCNDSPSAIQIGSDDRTAVAVCGRKLVRMDLIDGTQEELCMLSDSVSDLSFNVAHQLVAVAAGAADINIYDLNTGANKRTISRVGAPGSLSTAAVSHLSVAPDGNMLVSTTSGSRIFVSNIETGRWEHIMFVKYDGCDVVVSPNGRYVALFGAPKPSEISGHLTMFLVRRGLQPLWTRWHESEHPVTSCRFDPTSSFLVTTGAGDGARVWKTQSGDAQWHFRPKDNGSIRSAWSFGACDSLATLGDDLTIVRKGGGENVYKTRMPSSKSVFGISPSGKVLVVSDGETVVCVWKVDESA